MPQAVDYAGVIVDFDRIGRGDKEMTEKFIEGHKKLDIVEGLIKNKTFWRANGRQILGERQSNFVKVDPIESIGQELYGLETKQVMKIFDIFKGDGVSVIKAPVRSSYLDYDSFSDAELNELEAELDMYTDDEFDRMMEGAVTGMGKDDLSYDSMSDSSLPSSNAISYNSSSDAAYSYDSSSDGGLSGLAASYNSESEQSYQNSEHDASYDSESDEDS